MSPGEEAEKAFKHTQHFLDWCHSGRVPKKWATYCAAWVYSNYKVSDEISTQPQEK